MMSFQKPSDEVLRRFLLGQADRPFTYPDVGATATTPPRGYVVDHTRIKLGEGESVFLSAIAALRRWQQFHLGWVEAGPTNTPLVTGAEVAVIGWAMGVWWFNSCRIVYVVDESGPIHKFGFAYGTLPEHAESGEERFLIEWDHRDNAVWYDILAFSRPNFILTWLGYPIVRRLQKRFAKDSVASMQRACTTAIT